MSNESIFLPTIEVPNCDSKDLEEFFELHNAQLGSIGDEELSRIQPYDPDVGARIDYDHGLIKGFQDVVRLEGGLYLVVSDNDVLEDHFDKTIANDWMTLHFRLSGRSTEIYDGIGQATRSRAQCYAIIQPNEREIASFTKSGTRVRSVAICCKPTLMSDSLGLTPEDVPKSMQAFLEGGSSDLVFQALDITPGMYNALSEIVGSRYEGKWRQIHSRAKSMELMTMVFDGLNRKGETENLPIRLKPRDIEHLKEARAIIENSIRSPLTISQLSRAVGLNTKKLKLGFKHLFGSTVFDYSQELRMQLACQQLENRDLTVAQISDELGYSHPSNFTAAFKRHFHTLPNTYRAKF